MQEATKKVLVSKLHPLERAVLPALRRETSLPLVARAAGLSETEVMRSLQWLQNKKLLLLESGSRQVVLLDMNGIKYQKQGLPEKRFLAACGPRLQPVEDIAQKAGLSPEEITACLGMLKKRQAIEIRKGEELREVRGSVRESGQKKGNGLLAKITLPGETLLREGFPEELLLKKSFPLPLSELQETEKKLLEELRRRKEFLHFEEQKSFSAILTPLGKELAALDLSGKVLNRLSREMLRSGSWRKAEFRSYDVEINVPRRFPGKKHFVTQATEYARQIWIEMGFREMSGNFVQTSFWNFDALFTAQDHPVRELQDTFYLAEPEKGNLPPRKLLEAVRQAHEHGGTTGSSGWGGKWDAEEARRNVLRTHTTVLSAQTLAALRGKELPAKFFALGKNFRNEALDWSHLFEFNQTEGIVIDRKANFRHLLGYLKQFFSKMGFADARFRPAFFPYTEPSVEIDVWHPVHRKWVELGGAGMFRPEVVVPLLGEDVPVLAWGPGFDRLILDYYQLSDIRDLYRNDLVQLREMKCWLR